jgi:lipopolysaccharide export system protein LptA
MSTPGISKVSLQNSDEVTYAQAGRLKYDLDAGTVEFSDEAVITEGGNQISSSFLLYNILEQRINAQSSGEGDEKVKITVIPETIEEQLPEEDIAELEIPDLEIPEDRRQ